MDKKEIYSKLKANPKNIKFTEMCSYAKMFGFEFKGGKGSHRIFTKKGVREILNFQNVKGRAKPYQVRQFINIIERYNLLGENNERV